MLYKTDQTLIMTGEGESLYYDRRLKSGIVANQELRPDVRITTIGLKELLRTRLVECGWRDQVQMLCRDYVRKHGVYNVKVDDLIAEITPQGRALVPDSVKKELLQKIKAYLMQDVRK